METIDPERGAYYRQMVEVLESGYTLHYEELSSGLCDEEMTEEECKEVMDILDMFRVLKASYERLTDKTGISPGAVMFRGFDGNEEEKQYFYAKFLIDDQGKWAEFAGGELNTHTPYLPRYRQKLPRFQQIYQGKGLGKLHLTKAEILDVLGAFSVDPDSEMVM